MVIGLCKRILNDERTSQLRLRGSVVAFCAQGKRQLVKQHGHPAVQLAGGLFLCCHGTAHVDVRLAGFQPCQRSERAGGHFRISSRRLPIKPESLFALLLRFQSCCQVLAVRNSSANNTT
jgi:hypothetical protein